MNITTQDELDECEKGIADTIDSFWNCASYFARIRNKKLWPKDKYSSFEDYCERRWDVTASRARQITDAESVRASLPNAVANLITNERQARELGKVPEALRKDVVNEAKKNGPLTAKSIQTAAQSVTMVTPPQPLKMGKTDLPTSKNGPTKRPPVYDEIGWVIPDPALPFWDRREEIQDALNDVSRIKCMVADAKEAQDPMFGKVGNGVINDLKAAYTHLLEAKPYAVCTTCGGFFNVQPTGCSFCGNKGLISKWQWDTQSRKEVKDMRMKQVAKQ